jgi:autotransporter-associated beta strand protein
VILASAAAGVLAFDSAGWAQSISPINTSGWNSNNIYSSAAIGVGPFFENNFFGYSLYTNDAPYSPGSGGLPTSGTINSAANPNTTFQLQSFTSNNVLHLNNNPNPGYTTYNDYLTSGTISFATPAKYTNLAFLSADANGNTPVSYKITFQGGATTSGTFEGQDWYNGTGAAISNLDKVYTYGTIGLASSPYGAYDYYTSPSAQLYENDIAIPVADQLLNIDSVSFSIASSGSTQFNLYAISGAANNISFYVYTGAASNVWDTSSQNFSFNGSNASFATGGAVLFDDTAGTGSNVVSIAAGGVSPSLVVFNNSSSSYTINGPGGITGSGLLEVLGGGTVTLNTSNTYTGGTIVGAGTLILGSTGRIASNSIDVLQGATFTVNQGGQLTNSSVALDVDGTFTYNNANLSIASLSGAGSVNLNGTALTITQGQTVFAGTITDGSSPSSLTVNLPAANTFTLAGSSQYTGGTTLIGGTLLVGANSSLGTGPVSLAGGTIGTTAGQVALSNVVKGGALTVSNNTSSGTLELSGTANTFTGPVTIQTGSLQIDSPGAISGLNGANAAAGTITVASGASLIASGSSPYLGLTGGVSNGAPISLLLSGTGAGGTGALTTPGGTGSNVTWAGGVNLSGPALVAPGYGSGSSSSPTTLTLTGAITGNGPLQLGANDNSTNAGYSAIVLAPTVPGSNNYTGETQVYGDGAANGQLTVQLGANNGFNTQSGLNFNGAGATGVTVDLNGHNQSLAYLTNVGAAAASSQLTNSNTNTLSVLTISSGNSASGAAGFSVPITGNIAIVKTGPGNQSLGGTSTYTGGTTISAGTVTAASSNALGTGAVTLKGGTLSLAYPAGGIVPVVYAFSTAGFTSTGSHGISGSTLMLTDTNQGSEDTSAFSNTPLAFSNGFVASYQYTVTSREAAGGGEHYPADGMGFVLQNVGANAIGAGGGQLGWGGIGSPSAGILTNIYTYNTTPGLGFLTNGAKTSGSVFTDYDPTDFFDLEGSTSPITFNITLTYNATAGVITQVATTPSGTFTNNISTGNLATLLGGNNAYIGFTGSDGGDWAGQSISNFTYSVFGAGAPSIANNVIAAPSTSSVIQLSVASGFQAGAIGSLNIGSGALVKLASVSADGVATHGVLSTTGLTLSGSAGHWTGTLDLTNNALDVQNGSPAVLATITNQAKQGYAGGTWQGSGGITSSTAAADSRHLTAVGVILNDTNQAGGGTALYGQGGGIASTFDGATPSLDDVLVKYTYYGDVNLDGAVDGSDYAVVDNSFETEKSAGTHISGWGNGDFNYDGVVDGSDYTLMDNAFNQQGGSLGVNPAAQLANPTTLVAGGSAVPEPATFSLLGMGAIGLLGRRRRKNEVMA